MDYYKSQNNKKNKNKYRASSRCKMFLGYISNNLWNMEPQWISTPVDSLTVGTSKALMINMPSLHVILDVILSELDKSADRAGPTRLHLLHHGHNAGLQGLHRSWEQLSGLCKRSILNRKIQYLYEKVGQIYIGCILRCVVSISISHPFPLTGWLTNVILRMSLHRDPSNNLGVALGNLSVALRQFRSSYILIMPKELRESS